MPMLLYAQDEFGSVTDELIDGIAQRLGVDHASRCDEVISYYSHAPPQAAGKYHVQVCTNIACHARRRRGTAGALPAKSSESGIRKSRADGLFRSKKSSASAPAPGLRRFRSTTTFTST